jgi:predicted ArsR family transcriptional regulator
MSRPRFADSDIANVAAAPEIQAAARSMSTVAQRIRQEVARAGAQGCSHSDVLHATTLPTQVVQGAIEEIVERDEVRVEVTKSASGRGRPAKRYFAISKAERESRRALEEAAQTARTTSTDN